ncbi:MAG: hypothetical protein JKY25_06810 [Robiginitomaculum sp.]|nr:hypothetical protein [Robiginitomaculum sp.]
MRSFAAFHLVFSDIFITHIFAAPKLAGDDFVFLVKAFAIICIFAGAHGYARQDTIAGIHVRCLRFKLPATKGVNNRKFAALSALGHAPGLIS